MNHSSDTPRLLFTEDDRRHFLGLLYDVRGGLELLEESLSMYHEGLQSPSPAARNSWEEYRPRMLDTIGVMMTNTTAVRSQFEDIIAYVEATKVAQ